MEYNITCRDLRGCDTVYDLLVDAASGTGCLSGAKMCTDVHPDLPDVMTFELTDEEARALTEHPEVVNVSLNILQITTCTPTVKKQDGKIRFATTDISSTTNWTPHSLYCHTNFELTYTHENNDLNGTNTVTLSTTDCSNVDIIIVDTGVDPTHNDFLDSTGAASRVVDFDWSQLKDSAGNVIATNWNTLKANYNRDTGGHGTCCASLAAGNRCGFAKNAKIYSLRCIETTEGFDLGTALKLALAFQKAKKLNLYGLSSTRPTVISNSWGMNLKLLSLNVPTTEYNRRVDAGRGADNVISFSNTFVDSYTRQIIAEGAHFLVAAGNQNQYLNNTPTGLPTPEVGLIFFQRVDDNTQWVVINDSTTDTIAVNTVINSNIGGKSVSFKCTSRGNNSVNRGSPNIGSGNTKDSFPVIIVGDIVPIGNNAYAMIESANNSKKAYESLKSASETDLTARVSFTAPARALRYSSKTGPFYVKSSYSNFGPDVDVYAAGNATWAAQSNQLTNTPLLTVSAKEKYKFMNGTSAATPIAAGILASYLAERSMSTPAEARTWLINNSVKGNICETIATYLSITSRSTLSNTDISYDIPFGPSSETVLGNFPGYRTWLEWGSPATIEHFAFCHRFFDSNNNFIQAYPLRKGVFNTASSTVYDFHATLKVSTNTTEKLTHPY